MSLGRPGRACRSGDRRPGDHRMVAAAAVVDNPLFKGGAIGVAARGGAARGGYDSWWRQEDAAGSAGRTESTSDYGSHGCGPFLGLSSGPQA